MMGGTNFLERKEFKGPSFFFFGMLKRFTDSQGAIRPT